jgi:hypothetical protein
MVDTRLLIVLDDSVASRCAVKYVIKFVRKRRRFRIFLVHVLPPLPPALLEHGGSEDPAKEAQLEVDLKAEQHRWILDAKKTSQKSLDEACAALRKVGMSSGAVQALFCEPGEGPNQLTLFSRWPENAIAVRLLSAGSQFPGFTNYSARNCQKNFFAMAKGSVCGPSNDSEST